MDLADEGRLRGGPAGSTAAPNEPPFADTLGATRANRLVRAIVDAPTRSLGGDYLRDLVRYIASTLDVRHAFVALPVEPDGTRFRTVATWSEGALAPECEYELEGTPCQRAFIEGLCCIRDDVQALFPEDHLLGEMKAVSYLGMPLRGGSNEVIGIAAIVDDKPLEDADFATALFSVISERAGAEVERTQMEEALRERASRLSGLFEHSPISIWEEDYSGVKQVVDRLRRSGVEDFLAYFRAHPDELSDAISAVKLVGVNRATVELYGAPSAEAFVKDERKVRFASIDDFYLHEIAALASGSGEVEVEHFVPSYDGTRTLAVRTITHIPETHVDDWRLVVSTEEDVTARRRAEAMERHERSLYQAIASDSSLESVLEACCRRMEQQFPGSLCSVLTLDSSREHLRVAAAPSLPAAYNEAIDGLAIGLSAGSCGTAACFSRPVIAVDIATDPRWEGFKELANDHGLRACWSTPIRDPAIGTFAVYYRQSRQPTEEELTLIDRMGHLAGTAIERKRAEQAQLESESRFRDFAQIAADWFWETDAMHRAVYLSERFSEVTGVAANALVGHHVADIEIGREVTGDGFRRFLDRLRSQRAFSAFEYETVGFDGRRRVLSLSARPRFDTEGEFLGYRGSGTDITEARLLSEELTFHASHDALTGLVNRREFERRLERVLAAAHGAGEEHALCYLNLDQFKVINDTCGHAAGDALLHQLGQRLQGTVRRRDTLARLGGDEFGVLMEHCTLMQARRVANELRRTISEFAFHWDERVFRVGVSIGVVPIDGSSESITGVLSAADRACYVAKDGGRNRIHVHQAGDTEVARRHGEMQWADRIHDALENDRFHLFYQPIVPVTGRADDGDRFELLLRMEDRSGESVPPGAFLAAAERFGLSVVLDRWVVATAFEWLGGHPEHVERLDLCALNLSGASLADEDFLRFVRHCFERSTVPAGKIAFEVTETAAIANLPRTMRFIEELKQVGCRFAVEDFGSGLSSFAYLKTLPVDYLKIDGVLVRDVVDDPIDRAMVKSINEVAQLLGKPTIAEFVESDDILRELRAIGVDYAQGFGVGRPAPLDSMPPRSEADG